MRAVPRSCALLLPQQAGRARMCAWSLKRRPSRGRKLPVLVVTPRPGHDLLPLPSPRLGRDFIFRSRPSGRPIQVATSVPCRDLPSSPTKTNQVVTSKWGRDFKLPIAQVATSKRGRDPNGQCLLLRRQKQVAIPAKS